MPDISYFRTLYIVMHHIGNKARRPHCMDDKPLFRLAVVYGIKHLYGSVEIPWRIGFMHEAALNEGNIPDNVEWQE